MQSSQTVPEPAVPAQELGHHFADLAQQRETATLGMWLFLVTEIMFFGGMFTGYLVYRLRSPAAFFFASEHMNFWAGTINTAVLICSSLTMVLAVHAVQVGRRIRALGLLFATIAFGLVFLLIKAFEYHEHWVHHLFPGPSFQFHGADPAAAQMFFSLYFAMTGFHALHMVIGIGLVSTIAYFLWKGRYTPQYHNPVENVGLYWHFVDIVWIYLYPLLYLISHRHLTG